MKSIAEEIKFLELCKVLEDIQAAHKEFEKCEILKKFYKRYRKVGDEIKKDDSMADISFFPLLRLLLPHHEKQRPAYGLNKFALRRILAKMLCLSKDSEDFKKLGSEQHDFSVTAYGLLRKQFDKSANLSISQINVYLDSIAEKQDEKNVPHKDKIFLKLFQQMSPEEQKWIIRIILKKMGLGIGDTKILNLYHPNASIFLNDANSLLTVCDTLIDPAVKVIDSEIFLFTTFRPMLLRRCDAKEFLNVVNDTKTFIVENKFDGERFQLHMENDKFKYFSRNGYDYSKKFGETYNTGIFTPLLKGVFNINVKSIILDGEMMGWNRNAERFGSKGMSFDVKNLSDTSKHQACFCVFDILLFNGNILVKQPLKDRLEILKDIFAPQKGVIQHSSRIEASSKQDIIKALNDSMDRQEEGIVFKDPDSIYIPNSRNGNWWKMKLEYFLGTMSDLDLIIMGGFYGKAKKVDGFIVGVSIPIDAIRKKYLSLAKVTTGLSTEEWEAIRKRLEPHWMQTIDNNYENCRLVFGKMKPDVWIPPKKSCILEVRATELTKTNSGDFKTERTLRFARIMSIRFDKPCEDCLSLTELEELSSSHSPVQKLYNNHIRLEDIEYEVQKKKRFKPKFADSNVEVEETISDILKGYEFCVLSGTEESKVEDVEKLIKENGGKVVKSEGDGTYCFLAGKKHIRREYYKGSIDIVKLSWLQRVLDCRQMQPFSPQDMIYTSEKTKHYFLQNYDKYGDSYTDKTTRYNLECVLNNIKEKGDYICPLPSEIDELHKEMGIERKFNIFEKYQVYFDKYQIINNPLSEIIYDTALDAMVMKFWGGKCNNALTLNVNLIVTQCNNDRRKYEILAHDFCADGVKIVDKSFIYKEIDCISNNEQ